MAKLFFAALLASLLALPLFAQTNYEHFYYHPYAEYRFYTPHPYVSPEFDHTKHYPYRYHWSLHRWYAPYYYRRYNQYQYNYNQNHHYYNQSHHYNNQTHYYGPQVPQQGQNTNYGTSSGQYYQTPGNQSSTHYYDHPLMG